MKQKLFSILALLLMAATGAWAQFSADPYTADATVNGFNVTTNQTVTINEGVTVTVNGTVNIWSNVTLTVTGGGTLVVNGTDGANGQDGSVNTDPETGEEVGPREDPTPGGDGIAAIGIFYGGKLIISNATIIAVGGKGGQGGKNVDNSYAASGANGNGFASFPTIEGAVMSYSTNGTDYTEYASGDKTLYRYMKAVKVAPPTYSVTLADGTEDATNWTISPAEAAEGDQVTITYNGTKRVKSVAAVKKAATTPVTAITLNKTATEIKVGSTETLSVTAVAPDNATDKTYTWKTSDASKATVDQDGKVTAVAVGTVTIYAEANDGSGVKGNCTVTVTPAAAEGHALSGSVVGEIVGTDGLAYAVADKDNLPSGVTAAGMVAYKSGSNGLAIALADEASTMNWSTANGGTGAAAHTPTVTGYSWTLPSMDQWNMIVKGLSGQSADLSTSDNYYYTAYILKTKIEAAGGTGLQYDDYWSSTEYSGEGAWFFNAFFGKKDDSSKGGSKYVRSAFAF